MSAKELFVATLVIVSMLTLPIAPALAQENPDRPEVDTTVTRINVQEDGDAVWEIQYRTRLETDEEVATYEDFQESLRNDTDAYIAPFRDRMQNAVTTSQNDTSRQMSATNFEASTTIQQTPRTWGIVTFTFTWEDFAKVEGNQIQVGDVFGGGMYLSEEDVLMINGPDNYRVVEVIPDALNQGGALVWSGQIDFSSERPHVIYQNGTDTPTDTTTPPDDITSTPPDDTQTTTTPSDPNDEQDDSSALWVGGFLVLIVIAGLGYWMYSNREEEDSDTGDSEPSEEGGEGGEELVTNEERVLKYLNSKGGRAKQKSIGEEFEWSDARTSQLLSRMEDEGEINRLRMGREKIVEIPDDGEEEET